MPPKMYLILRSARWARLEGRTALLQRTFPASRGYAKIPRKPGPTWAVTERWRGGPRLSARIKPVAKGPWGCEFVNRISSQALT